MCVNIVRFVFTGVSLFTSIVSGVVQGSISDLFTACNSVFRKCIPLARGAPYDLAPSPHLVVVTPLTGCVVLVLTAGSES